VPIEWATRIGTEVPVYAWGPSVPLYAWGQNKLSSLRCMVIKIGSGEVEGGRVAKKEKGKALKLEI
jgi:hypothetical protein